MITDGTYFKGTIDALKLNPEQAEDTKRNAMDIVSAIVTGYGGTVENGIDTNHTPPSPVTGLVYGRIQSGKTRAMIASTAMAFDNRFRVVVVMTSNINDLVSQTHFDFTNGLPGVMTYTKDNDLSKEIENVKIYLEKGDACLLIIASKAVGSLENVAKFLTEVGANKYSAIIFDDEGDQASLDTNIARRARSRVSVAPSKVNEAIQNKLRVSLPRHVYVSVTGTPQAVLLQSADSTHRPSFIVMLPPGGSYIGGDYFFNTEEPEDNPHNLITLVDQNEKKQLLNQDEPIPDGLRRSILFFLVASAAAIKNENTPDKGYSYLCHPSLKNNEQSIAESRINNFLTEVTKVLLGEEDTDILQELQDVHNELKISLKEKTLALDEIKNIILQYLPTRRLLVINTKVKRQGIAYGTGLNFLIGGNTLGRGIAIRDLLVTYYVRDAKVSQIDTMHQHARMYGYRKKTLSYTRLFIPRHLYYKFRDIHQSDTDSRNFIDENKDTLPTTFPIEYTYNLRTTRPGVLDVNKTGTLRPSMHIYPNYVSIPQNQKSYQKTLGLLREHLGFTTETVQEISEVGKIGKIITKEQAIALVKPIKTLSQNTWQDKTIDVVIEKVANQFGGNVLLKFRTADRRVREGGFISTGTLSGAELSQARDNEQMPTLWIMSANTTGESAIPGETFMYPTFVIPNNFPKLFLFNLG